ncbi:hypothetical protein ACLOJK_034064 [Asimina triloba]
MGRRCGRVWQRRKKRGKRGKKKKEKRREEGEKEKRGRGKEEGEEKKRRRKRKEIRIADGAQPGVGAQTGVRRDPGPSGQSLYTGDSLYPTAPDSREMLPNFSVVVTAIGKEKETEEEHSCSIDGVKEELSSHDIGWGGIVLEIGSQGAVFIDLEVQVTWIQGCYSRNLHFLLAKQDG